jgi:hypothetical protein
MGIKAPEITMLPDGRLIARDAATYLGYSKRHFARLRGERTGPDFVRIGTRCWYYKQVLDQWIANGGPKKNAP